ncbi:hypothetical protein DTA24_07795 [Klebsiella sp. P1CD1]|uniref:hypothetical protein n=1 Tax=Klebsiella sp. P1CD1 TaxID=2267618 RepID=UPI000F4D9D03|nr:hypothetical protein [Klebsiella sp. P1CD1]AYW18557.1 hypothetical protein DTA24_07795 [Klebsiella sp. P1CD1]
MTKSTITREQLEELAAGQSGFNLRIASHEESQELARMALAIIRSEPHADDELSNLLWYSQEATCHSDPNYYCEFQRLATPGLIAGIIRELQERRKADSEPVAWLLSGGGAKNVVCFDSGNAYSDPLREVTPLYRHAQQPVVPDAIPVSRDIDAGYLSGWNDCRAAMLKEENATKWWHGLYKEIKGRGQCSEGDFTPDLSMSTEEIIDEINGWTENHKANAALIMLDRIETADPADDDRIEDIKRIVRELANNQKEIK